MRVRCADGRVRVVLSIDEVSRRGNLYRNFKVRVVYRPDTSGLTAQLVRDGIIELEGKRLGTKSQVVLRGVFAKLFPRNRPVPLTHSLAGYGKQLAGCQMTQFDVEDGWIGLALGPQRTTSKDRVALKTTVAR